LADASRVRRGRFVIDKAATVDGTVKIFKMDQARVEKLDRMIAKILEREPAAGARRTRHPHVAA